MNENYRAFSYGKLVYLLSKTGKNQGLNKNDIFTILRYGNWYANGIDDGTASDYINGKMPLIKYKNSLITDNFDRDQYWAVLRGDSFFDSDKTKKTYFFDLFEEKNYNTLKELILSILADSLIPDLTKKDMCLYFNSDRKLSLTELISYDNIAQIFYFNGLGHLSEMERNNAKYEIANKRLNFFKLILNIATSSYLDELTNIEINNVNSNNSFIEKYGQPERANKKTKCYNYILKIPETLLWKYADKWFANNTNNKETQSNAIDYRIISSPINKNYNFLDDSRKDELDIINKALMKNTVIFIHGIGGIGKTELVNEYLFNNQDNYDHIIYTKYDRSLQDIIINDTILNIVGVSRKQSNEKVETDKEYALRKLGILKRISNKKVLWIVDNFDSENDPLFDEVIHGSYTLIFTTRVDYSDTGCFQIDINELDDAKLFDLFCKYYKRTIIQGEEKTIKKIISYVKGHTLTVELIAKLMNNTRKSAQEIYDVISSKGISPSLNGKVKHGLLSENTDVYSHISKLFSMDTLSEEEMTIMKSMILVPIYGSPTKLLLELNELDDQYDIINNLVQRSWLSYDEKEDVVSVHPVIRDIVWNRCNKKDKSLSLFIKNIESLCNSSYGLTYSTKNLLGDIGIKLLDFIEPDYNEYFFTIASLVECFLNLNRLETANNCLEIMKASIIDQDSKEAAVYWFRVGDNSLRQNDFDNAITAVKESQSILRRIMPNSYEYAFVSKHLAHIYHAKCEKGFKSEALVNAAYEMLNECANYFDDVNRCPTTTKKEISLFCSYWYALSLNEYLKGDSKAKDTAEKSYKEYVKNFGENCTDTTAPMRVMALCLSKEGNLEAALNLQRDVIRIREEQWDKNHYRYFEQLEFLADIYFENQKIEDGINELYNILNMININKDYYNNYIEHLKEKIAVYEARQIEHQL